MTTESMTLEKFTAEAKERGVHTVEVVTADTMGHLRGKRVPIDRFVKSTITTGVNIADAIFVFDVQGQLIEDHPTLNMDTGFLDCTLIPDIASARFLTHRPGYALVFCNVFGPDGSELQIAPRNVLRKQVAACSELGLTPFVATELEFYLMHLDLTPVQSYIQYSSVTDGLGFEDIIVEIRDAVAGAGIEVESSNAEYGPGQYEVNCGPADALRTADNTVLFKSIIKQIARKHDLVASFMPKPYFEESGSGMHIHISLTGDDGGNLFADSHHQPNETMGHWLAGELKHAQAMTLLGSPTPNGFKRIQPYTFAPTHVHWGGDNRTVMARCIAEPNSAANRIEYRNAGADANPYLIIAALLAAGSDGISNKLSPPDKSEGDMYTNPGECPPLPNNIDDAIAAFDGSELAHMLGDVFADSFVAVERTEAALGNEHAADPESVTAWELQRYSEHT